MPDAIDDSILSFLVPYPQSVQVASTMSKPSCLTLCGDAIPEHAKEEVQAAGVPVTDVTGAFPLKFEFSSALTRDEFYRLEVGPDGIVLTGADCVSIQHGFQTLLQVFSLWSNRPHWPAIIIEDWPTYATRSVMLDMGRSVFPLVMLKRVVRILARLKMNQLHLHLLDDELCGIRFDGMPFGEDNPYALSIQGLGELIAYARDYHVEVVPELETWGHVGSLTYHRPELRGGPGMFNGASFKISTRTFKLIEAMADQVVAVMPEQGRLHMGLDEAKWFVDETLPNDYSRHDLVLNYRDMVQRLGSKHGKRLAMTCFCDHAWTDLPHDVSGSILYEPWQYWARNTADIDQKIERFAGMTDTAWLMALGQSRGHVKGAHRATRYFCRQATEAANCRGIDICLWAWNDLEAKMNTLVAGAYFGWNPLAPTHLAELEDAEQFEWKLFPVLEWWQSAFRDAFPDQIRADRGPLVHNGYYLWGERHGEPVSPTVPAAGTRKGHDFANEAKASQHDGA